MLVYLIKFSICLVIFVAFYKLFLEQENMHVFKRYYLLSVLGLALLIPSITFIEYVDPSVLGDLAYSTPPYIPEYMEFAETSKFLSYNVVEYLWFRRLSIRNKIYL